MQNELKNYPWWKYTFKVVDIARNKVICTFQVQAQRDLDAMQAFCANPLIQGMDMKDEELTLISRVKLEKFQNDQYLEPQITMYVGDEKVRGLNPGSPF